MSVRIGLGLRLGFEMADVRLAHRSVVPNLCDVTGRSIWSEQLDRSWHIGTFRQSLASVDAVASICEGLDCVLADAEGATLLERVGRRHGCLPITSEGELAEERGNCYTPQGFSQVRSQKGE